MKLLQEPQWCHQMTMFMVQGNGSHSEAVVKLYLFLKIDWYIVKCVAAEQPHTVQHTKTLLFLNVGTLKIMIGEKNMP